MSELIRKLKEKKFITKIKVKEDISDELLSKEITQRGSLKIVEEVKKEIGPVASEIAVTRETNPELMDVCVANRWAANNDYMTYKEAAAITNDDIKPLESTMVGMTIYTSKFKTLTHFEEFQWFSGVHIINDGTFQDCSNLTSVIIPDSVTSIGYNAFYNCSSLISINILDSVTSIGGNAFMGCSGLTSITIGNSVTSIDHYTFYDCGRLESIVVGSGNSKYDSRDNCNAIIETDTNALIRGCENTIIPDSVTSIGNSAFNSCSGLTNITIPNSVTSIVSNAFIGCTGLSSITVGSGNSKYDSRDNCNAIIETDTNTLFLGCKNTTIPDSVTSIGDSAFSYCSGLTSITIPDSVTSIGGSAFSYCSGLTSITIGNSVTSIDSGTFEYCGSLSSITCLATTAPSVSSGTFGYYDSSYTGRNTYNQGTNKLKVPTGATGYDAGEWLDPLCNAEKCGFTIEYI